MLQSTTIENTKAAAAGHFLKISIWDVAAHFGFRQREGGERSGENRYRRLKDDSSVTNIFASGHFYHARWRLFVQQNTRVASRTAANFHTLILRWHCHDADAACARAHGRLHFRKRLTHTHSRLADGQALRMKPPRSDGLFLGDRPSHQKPRLWRLFLFHIRIATVALHGKFLDFPLYALRPAVIFTFECAKVR